MQDHKPRDARAEDRKAWLGRRGGNAVADRDARATLTPEASAPSEAHEFVARMLAGEMQPACDALLSSGPTVVTWPGAGKE